MHPAGTRRRLLFGGSVTALAAACGRSANDTAGPVHRWLPPARVELWLGGIAAPVEHVIRTSVLPTLRSTFPTMVVTVAGTAPPPPGGTARPLPGTTANGAGVNPSVMGSSGGRLNGTTSLALRGPTADGDAFNRLVADHAAGVAADVIPAGTGNVSTVRHLRAARPVEDVELLTSMARDFTPGSVAQVRGESGPIGVPWLANPRRYVWRADQLAGLGGRVPESWEDVVLACGRAAPGRPRTTSRRTIAVNGLHLEFYEALRHRGVEAIEHGVAAFAGDEGVAVAQFFADRGHTDTVGRYGSGATWGSDLAGQGVAGAWTTLAGLMRVITSATMTAASLRVGRPVGPGGVTYPADASARGAIATHAWWFVSSSTKVPDHAWPLLRALVDPDAMVAAAAATWQVPVRRSAASRGFLAHPLVREFVAPYVEDSIDAPTLPVPLDMEPVLLNRLNAIARGEVKPSQALREAARLWDEAIARAGHPLSPAT